MKKLTCFALLLLLLGQYRPAVAQTCSAAFTYTVGSNKTVNFFAADSNGLTHHWLFGDGSSVTTTGFAITHAYAQSGQYTVVHATERPGTTCHDSAAKLIVIPADSCTITARFQYYKDSLDCKKIHFINYSAPISPNVHFAWNFGDGSSSADISPVHTYSQTGTYLVSLVSEAGTNCRKQYWDTVVVRCGDTCAVKANFSARADSLVRGKFYFTNLSQPSAGLQYTWVFGDGSIPSHDISPTHVYAQPGTYNVYLVARLNSTCADSMAGTMRVLPDSCTITALFKYYKDSLDCKKIHFINYSTPLSPNVHFAWSFGDGSSSNDINPAHTYSQTGTYLVSLVSEAGTNCRRQFWDTVVVNCGDSCAIQPYFSWKADSLTAGKIYFTNLGKSAAGIHYSWNFGDSSAQSHDISPAHVYAHAGKYTVCLVAELGSNCRKVYCLAIEVKEISHCTTRAAFGYFRLAWMPLTVRFEALNQGDTAKYYWSFGDSSYGNGRLINHSYAQSGLYNTCLTVVSGNCSVVSCQPVFVTPDSVLNLPQLVQAVPNPAINSVSINVTLDRPETVIIRILDGTGVVKAVFSKNGTTGNNRFTLPVERLSRGIYLVEIRTSTRHWFSRFQKG